MSPTWRNVAYFHPDRANLATWFLVCRHTFVSRFSDIDVPRTDEIRLSLLLIPTSNVDLHNRSPQQKGQKIIRRLHRRTRFVCLFVRSFVPLVGCCVVSLPLVVASRPVPSQCRTTSLRYVSSLVVPLVIVESSHRHVVTSRLTLSLYRAP